MRSKTSLPIIQPCKKCRPVLTHLLIRQAMLNKVQQICRFIFINPYVWVALGGALGSVARFWVSVLIAGKFGDKFPWGTLLANVSGSFLIGLLATTLGAESRHAAAPPLRLYLMVGVCGGYTTFSSFSLQTLDLIQKGQWLNAGLNVSLSVVLCLFGVWLGYSLGLILNSSK